MGGKEYSVAIVGATGVVGRDLIRMLEERDFPVKKLRLLASKRSKGKILPFKGEGIAVEELTSSSLEGIEIAFFSVDSELSKEFAPIAVKAGALVIDDSSAFRLDKDVPLVVPEVNPQAAFRHKGIIAGPNCSTIQMVMVLKPIHDAVKIKRVVVSTYQSVSGWGKEAVDQLWEEMENILDRRSKSDAFSLFTTRTSRKVLPHQIAFNLIPHIDKFLENGYSKEEMKMVWETRKILEEETLPITATCVRVPVVISHSEAVNIETEKELSPEEAREILSRFQGIRVVDHPQEGKYPLPLEAMGKDEVFVGRIRRDESLKHGLNLWIVSDNLRKGAGLNAIQIAELLVKERRI